jgi:ABC-2 type transport system ATP-binding protein
MTSHPILRARGLGKKYGRRCALAECDLDLPAGHVVGLVGPNGAGKTTLLGLAAGLLTPTSGTIEVCGSRPGSGRAQLAKVGFVAQDTPTYRRLSVADHLTMGRRLSQRWDDDLAWCRVRRLGLAPRTRAGQLSGGQRAQLALTLAIAKRPELLVLDEPVASLDPLARRDFLEDLREATAGHELSVVLSSHLVSDIERVCDYLVVLVASRVQAAGDVSRLLATHHWITRPRASRATLPPGLHVLQETGDAGEVATLVRADMPMHHPEWEVRPASLEDLVLGHLSTGSRRELEARR